MNWNKLSMADKAALMRIYIQNGINDLDAMREHYNTFQDGGPVKPQMSKTVGRLEVKQSKEKDNEEEQKLIELHIKQNNHLNEDYYKGAAMQGKGSSKPRTKLEKLLQYPLIKWSPNAFFGREDSGPAIMSYLYPRKRQHSFMLDNGYIEDTTTTTDGKKDYGLVKKAVGDRDIPMYQAAPDAISRDEVTPLYTVKDNVEFSYEPSIDPGHYPYAVYMDSKDPTKFYTKSWDLVDFGGDNSGYGYTKAQEIKAKMADIIGSPTVTTSGFQPLKVDDYNYQSIIDALKEKGLHYELIDGKPVLAHDEVVVSGKEHKHGGQLGKVTPYGQWQYPGEVTTIPSNNITMKGVGYPVIGISDTGDTKYMLPNMDYLFEGNYVTEYPVHKR